MLKVFNPTNKLSDDEVLIKVLRYFKCFALKPQFVDPTKTMSKLPDTTSTQVLRMIKSYKDQVDSRETQK